MKGLLRVAIIFLVFIQSAYGSSIISYTLNSSPIDTDQLILIDDPSGSWSVNRVTIDDILSLIDDANIPDTITVGASGSVNASALPTNVQTFNAITPSSNVQSLLGAATYAAMRTLLDLEAGTDFYSITAADAAFEPLGVTESDISDLGTTVTLNADTDVSGNSWVLNEDDFASDSATKVPTQQSVGAYIAALKLDDLASPDDNTDLNVSITAHGLVPKAPNDIEQWLRGDGSWSTIPYDGYALNIIITDISTAGYYYVPVPYAGDITLIQSVISGTIATADVTLTGYIGGVAITDGSITVAYSGSAAGDYDSATPSGANTVAAGDIIRIYTDGASTNTVTASITIWIER
jgi:hypothetical protein